MLRKLCSRDWDNFAWAFCAWAFCASFHHHPISSTATTMTHPTKFRRKVSFDSPISWLVVPSLPFLFTARSPLIAVLSQLYLQVCTFQNPPQIPTRKQRQHVADHHYNLFSPLQSSLSLMCNPHPRHSLSTPSPTVIRLTLPCLIRRYHHTRCIPFRSRRARRTGKCRIRGHSWRR